MVTDELAPGASKYFYEFDHTMDLQLSAHPAGFEPIDAPSISFSTRHNAEELLSLRDTHSGRRGEKLRTLDLALEYFDNGNAACSKHLSIRAPYWIVNHTGFPISIKEVFVCSSSLCPSLFNRAISFRLTPSSSFQTAMRLFFSHALNFRSGFSFKCSWFVLSELSMALIMNC
jgi:hypothetical protein